MIASCMNNKALLSSQTHRLFGRRCLQCKMHFKSLLMILEFMLLMCFVYFICSPSMFAVCYSICMCVCLCVCVLLLLCPAPGWLMISTPTGVIRVMTSHFWPPTERGLTHIRMHTHTHTHTETDGPRTTGPSLPSFLHLLMICHFYKITSTDTLSHLTAAANQQTNLLFRVFIQYFIEEGGRRDVTRATISHPGGATWVGNNQKYHVLFYKPSTAAV